MYCLHVVKIRQLITEKNLIVMKFRLLISLALIGILTIVHPSTMHAQTQEDSKNSEEITSNTNSQNVSITQEEQAVPTTDYNQASFFDAITTGQIDAAKHMIKDSADYYQHNKSGESALTAAILTNNVEMVTLLEKKAVINLKNKAGETPLTLAIKHGNKAIIDIIMQRAKAALKNNAGEAPLFLALDLKDFHLMKQLLENGADINRKSNGITPLSKAVELNDYKLVGFLVKNGAIPNIANDNGEIPLYLAAKNGYDIISGILIAKSPDAYSDANWTSLIGETLLNIATANGHLEIVNLLIRNGAEVNTTDHLDNTALCIAAAKGYDSLVEVFLQNEADVNHRNLKGETPLIIASEQKNDSTIKLLLDRGANPNMRNYQGYAAADFHPIAGTYKAQIKSNPNLYPNSEQTKIDAPNRASNIIPEN